MDGFDFLGQNIRRYGNKLLIKPSNKSISNLLDKVRGIIKDNKAVTSGILIMMLNPVIRGWANYHRHVVSKKVFAKVDHEIWKAIWNWAKRRHPNKSLGWVRAKYFAREGGNSWTFVGESRDGKKVTLFMATYLPITRHIKIRKEFNPYDPTWKEYLRKRTVKSAVNLSIIRAARPPGAL